MKTAKETKERYHSITEDVCEGYQHEHILAAMREHALDMLTEYTEFLMEEGYCDADVYSEGNTAIDRFLHPKLREL